MNEPISTPCPEWEEKLAGIDLDDLSTSEREALNFHLLSCPACAAALADYQKMDLLIDRALTNDLPLELPEDFAVSRQHHVQQTLSGHTPLKAFRRILQAILRLLTAVSGILSKKGN